ncbi:MAG: hypothetical protein II738_08015, partial [Clostridia bacterium]|nr:hypothetical protein [Clostridia bacterium]
HSDAGNVEEHDVITNNPTSEFVNTYGGGWLPTDPQRLNSNSVNMTGFPDGEFAIEGSTFDTSGCYNYNFRYTFNFHGRPAGDYGEIKTGYVWNLELYWARTDTIFSNKKTTYVRLGTDITVTDVRELNNTIAAKEAELADPNSHITDEYRQSTLQTLGSIPADMKDGSTFYTQAEVDAYTNALNGIVNDVADYSAYEEKYAEALTLINDNNANDKYNAAVFAEFVEDVTGLNNALNRGLPASQQAAVNTATRLIQAAIDKLLANPNLQDALEQAIADGLAALDPAQNGGKEFVDGTADALQQAIAAAQIVAAKTDATTAEQASAIAAINDAINGLIENADYSDYNDKKDEIEDILNNHSDEYDPAALAQLQDALTNVDNALDKDLPADNQADVDNAAGQLQDALDAVAPYRKADYTELDDAITAAQDALNDGNTYTAGTLAELQEKLAEAQAVPRDMTVGENGENQAVIDDAAQALNDALDALTVNSNPGAADYSELERQIARKEALNGDNYVSAAWNTVEQVYGTAMQVENMKNTPYGSKVPQNTIDQAANALKAALDALVAKADSSAYEAKKAEAEAVTNDDSTYDATAFAQYQQSVAEITQQVTDAGEIPDTDEGRAVYTAAITALQDAMAALEQNQNIFLTYVDEFGAELQKTPLLPGTPYGAVKDSAPTLPEDATFRYYGWQAEDGTLVTDDRTFDADATLTYAKEYKVLKPVENSTVTLVTDESAGIWYVYGVAPETNLDSVLAQFVNDNLTVVDVNGGDVAAMDEVGTGTAIAVTSGYDGTVYQTWRLVVMGDVNGDARVTAADYTASKAVSLGEQQYPDAAQFFFAANDMNDDGMIDVLDCTLIRRAQIDK